MNVSVSKLIELEAIKDDITYLHKKPKESSHAFKL